jgi:D-tyrosyl-tRNA(Tyr) deacylase
LLVLLGVARGDGDRELEYVAEKTLNLRIFPDDEGKMNLSVLDIAGEVTVVSQFTLLADTRKGRRPSFVGAAGPEEAEPVYEDFVGLMKASGLKVGTGGFGEMMVVSLDNWGPVTIVIDSTV